MSVGIAVVCLAILWSYFRAQRLGIPWFGWCKRGKTLQSVKYKRLGVSGIRSQSSWLSSNASKESPPPYHRLNELTRSPEASVRLVARISALNPEKDIAWCIDKAVYDIKRDRMA